MIEVHCGGNANDIYQMDVVSNHKEHIQDLNPYQGYVYVQNALGDSVLIAGFYKN
jgi:hypothetical protein